MGLRYEIPGSTVDYVLNASTGSTYYVTLKKVVTGGADTVAVPRTSTGVAEDPADSGIYVASVTLPVEPADYYPLWDNGGTPIRDDDITRVTYSIPASASPGAPYFTPDEFRAKWPGDADVQALDDDRIDSERLLAEEIIEKACNVAFVPREKTLSLVGEPSTKLALPLYLVRSLTSVTVAGDVVADLSAYRIVRSAIYRPSSWLRRDVVVTVEHGYDAPPLEIKHAAMLLTKHLAIRGPIDDRATSIPAGEAGGTITLLVPGQNGAVTGIPAVDRAIVAYRLPDPSSVSSVVAGDPVPDYPATYDDFATG